MKSFDYLRSFESLKAKYVIGFLKNLKFFWKIFVTFQEQYNLRFEKAQVYIYYVYKIQCDQLQLHALHCRGIGTISYSVMQTFVSDF